MNLIIEAWKDRKMNELFELSSYTDEKGWLTQSIDRAKAREFICQLISELLNKIGDSGKYKNE